MTFELKYFVRLRTPSLHVNRFILPQTTSAGITWEIECHTTCGCLVASLKQFRFAERVLPDEARRMKVACNAIHRRKVEYLGSIELACESTKLVNGHSRRIECRRTLWHWSDFRFPRDWLYGDFDGFFFSGNVESAVTIVETGLNAIDAGENEPWDQGLTICAARFRDRMCGDLVIWVD